MFTEYKDNVGKPEGKRQLGNLGVEGRVIKKVVKKHDMWVWIGFVWLRQWQVLMNIMNLQAP
jgi:hypothetical protein